jgi:hypothetical protein
MKNLKDRGCVGILLIGLFAGMITGGIVGVNIASWNYAGIIAQGYTEIIQSETGDLFVRFQGKLFRLETVKDHEELNKKINEILEKMEEHEEEDKEEFKKLQDSIN